MATITQEKLSSARKNVQREYEKHFNNTLVTISEHNPDDYKKKETC